MCTEILIRGTGTVLGCVGDVRDFMHPAAPVFLPDTPPGANASECCLCWLDGDKSAAACGHEKVPDSDAARDFTVEEWRKASA